MSQANREGITPKPTHKSATASETIKVLVLVQRFPLLQTTTSQLIGGTIAVKPR